LNIFGRGFDSRHLHHFKLQRSPTKAGNPSNSKGSGLFCGRWPPLVCDAAPGTPAALESVNCLRLGRSVGSHRHRGWHRQDSSEKPAFIRWWATCSWDWGAGVREKRDSARRLLAAGVDPSNNAW